MGEWVSVKDRLPEKLGSYLCAFKDGRVGLCRFVAWRYWWEEGTMYPLPTVTHWMPLPDHPEAKP